MDSNGGHLESVTDSKRRVRLAASSINEYGGGSHPSGHRERMVSWAVHTGEVGYSGALWKGSHIVDGILGGLGNI